MTISENHTNILCNGGNDGSIDITVTGGTGNYTYLWNNGDTTEDLNNIPIGIYSVVVTDENECSIEIEVEITEPEVLSISFVTNPGEYSDCNSGQVVAVVEGGTGPYSYEWDNGSTDSNLFGLCAGDYFVVVTLWIG